MKVRTDDLAGNIVLALYLIITILAIFAKTSIVSANMLRLIVGSLAVLITIVFKGWKKQTPFLTYIIIYSVTGLLSFFYNGNADIQELLWPLGFMSIALLFLNFKLSFELIKCFFYTFCLMMIIVVVRNGGIDRIALNGSRNGISVYVFLFFTMLAIAAYQHKKSISLIVPLLSFFVCIMAIGRSGILTGALTIIFFLLFKFSKGEIVRRKIWILPTVIIVVVLMGFSIYYLVPEFFNRALGNFQNRGMESIRSHMWMEYLNSAVSSIPNILFGAKISGTNLLNAYSENLHNSFVMLQAKYGIIGFLITISLIVKSIVFLAKTRNGFLIVPLFIILFRMNFDYTNFNGPLDTVLMFYIMFPFYATQNPRTDKNRWLIVEKDYKHIEGE